MHQFLKWCNNPLEELDLVDPSLVLMILLQLHAYLLQKKIKNKKWCLLIYLELWQNDFQSSKQQKTINTWQA